MACSLDGSLRGCLQTARYEPQGDRRVFRACHSAGAGTPDLTQDLGGLDRNRTVTVTVRPGRSATIRIPGIRGGMPRSGELKCQEKTPGPK